MKKGDKLGITGFGTCPATGRTAREDRLPATGGVTGIAAATPRIAVHSQPNSSSIPD